MYVCAAGKHSARKLKRAQILSPPGGDQAGPAASRPRYQLAVPIQGKAEA
jgi:hypothetical protein